MYERPSPAAPGPRLGWHLGARHGQHGCDRDARLDGQLDAFHTWLHRHGDARDRDHPVLDLG
jgi:hypothetical protein